MRLCCTCHIFTEMFECKPAAFCHGIQFVVKVVAMQDYTPAR